MPVIPRDIAEASKWLQKGLLRPLREAQMTDNGVIIGARKATLWERFKVTFVCDTKKIKQINNLNSQAWTIYAKNQAKKLEGMAVTEAPADYTHYHLFDKHFDRMLRLGFFPVGDRSSKVTHEVEARGTRPSFNHKKLTEKNKLFEQSGFTVNRPYWAQWSYSHSKTPLINRVPMPTVVFGEGSNKVGGKHAAGVSGWAAVHFVEKTVDPRTKTRVTYSKVEANFSTIPTAAADIAPTEIPDSFTARQDFTDKKGIIQHSINATWTLVQKTAKDVSKDGAWYKCQYTMPNGEVKDYTRFFKRHEMVNHPRNLVVELQNGDTVVYAVLLNKNNQNQWYERYYFADGRKADWRESGLNPIVWVPNAEMSRHIKAKKAEPAVQKETRFQKQQILTYDVDTPVSELYKHSETQVKRVNPQKQHDELAHNYDDEYGARFKQLNADTSETIQALQDEGRHSILSDDKKKALTKLTDLQNHLRGVAEKRSFFHSRAKDSEEIWHHGYGKKIIPREQLRPMDDVEEAMKGYKASDLKLTRSRKIDGHRKVVKFVPHLMQDENWKAQILAQFDLGLIREELTDKLKDPNKRAEFMAETRVKGDRYVELSDAIQDGVNLLSADEVNLGKLSKISDAIDHFLDRADHHHERLQGLIEKLKLANAAYMMHKDGDSKTEEHHRSILRATYIDAENAQIELKSFTDRLNVCQQEFIEHISSVMENDIEDAGNQRIFAKRYPNVRFVGDYDRPVDHAVEIIARAEELLSGVVITPAKPAEEEIYMEMEPQVESTYSLRGHEEVEEAEVIDQSTRPPLPIPEIEIEETSSEDTSSDEGEEVYAEVPEELIRNRAIKEGIYQVPPKPVAAPVDDGQYNRITKQVHFNLPPVSAFVVDENIVDEVAEEELDEEEAAVKLATISEEDSDSLSSLDLNPLYDSAKPVNDQELDQKLAEAKQQFKTLYENMRVNRVIENIKRVPPPLPPKETAV